MREVFLFRRLSASTRLSLLAGLALVTMSGAARADASSLPPEIGYNYGQTEAPRTAGMAGALRAFSNSTDALFMNPANMATSRVYHLAALAQIWPEASRQTYGAAIVDSIVSASRLAGGLAASWTGQDPSGVDRSAFDVRFALAFPFSEHFYLGATGRYLSLQQNGFPRGLYNLPPSLASGGTHGEAIVQAITFDAGATLKPIPELALSIVGSNLTNPGNQFLPLMFGGGIGYGSADFTVEADALADFTTYDKTKARAMLGGEYLAADRVPLRLGYRYDQGADTHAVTGGVGYLDSAYSVDLSVQRTVSGPGATAIIFGFAYHVESGGGLNPEE
jgi:opacity protein-like surface antigen